MTVDVYTVVEQGSMAREGLDSRTTSCELSYNRALYFPADVIAGSRF